MPEPVHEPAILERVVPPEWEGTRLDRAVCTLFPERSRTRVQAWIRGGRVRLDGTAVRRPAHLLERGRTLRVDPPREDGRRVSSGPGQFAVLHDEEDFAVVDKPPGMVAHPTSAVAGGTVSEVATERWGKLPEPQGADRPGVVHRLDGATSGVMVVVKTERASESLREQFRERKVEKRYLALVHGDPRFDSDWIDAPLGRGPDHLDRVAVLPAGEGRPAQTYYEVRERFGSHTLLECRPRTGRTHQIRVHLESIGHPIVADRLYTGGRGWPEPAGAPHLARQALHAWRLAFAHPASGERVEFEAPLAPDIAALVDWLRARATP